MVNIDKDNDYDILGDYIDEDSSKVDNGLPKPGAVLAYSSGCVNLIATGDYNNLNSKIRIYQDIAPYGAIIKVVDTSDISNIEDVIKDPKKITQTFEKWFL